MAVRLLQRTLRALTLLNTAKAATYEMLIDLDQVRRAGLSFDVRFGAGAPLRLGDEYVFIADMLRAGLTGSAVPAVFGMHSVVSSGSMWGTARDTHERAVVLNRVFGRWAPLARAVFAVKHWRRSAAPGSRWRWSPTAPGRHRPSSAPTRVGSDPQESPPAVPEVPAVTSSRRYSS